MAKVMRKSIKVTIISLVVALCIACAGILFAVLSKRDPNFLSADQRAFFSSLQTEANYVSNATRRDVSLGDASFDRALVSNEDFAIVSDSGVKKLVTQKTSHVGQTIDVVFDSIVYAKGTTIIAKKNDLYYAYKLSYENSTYVATTYSFVDVEEVSVLDELVVLYKNRVLTVAKLSDLSEVFVAENVQEFNAGNFGFSYTTLLIDGQNVKSETVVKKVVGSLIQNTFKFENNLRIAEVLDDATVLIDGENFVIEEIYRCQMVGNFVFIRHMVAVENSEADLVYSAGSFKLNQKLVNTATNKTVSLSMSAKSSAAMGASFASV